MSLMMVYRIGTFIITPAVPFWLQWRAFKKKEDRARLRERYGIPSFNRPEGLLIWLHAASVGEANSLLTFIGRVRERFPQVRMLITTGTVTSAALMKKRLPADVIHQYVPVDTPEATMRFIRHWKPDIAFWVESELWPNLIYSAKAYYCFMGIINGRMSEKSYTFWQKAPSLIRQMLGSFSIIFPQTEKDAERFIGLGVKPKNIINAGNLKYDGAELPFNESELFALSDVLEDRPRWLAASTHPGEEEMVATTHRLLSATRSNLLTIVIPRHASRGPQVAAALSKFGKVALRSKGEKITKATKFYVADTMGELGLFYRMSEVVFMGGSLVPHGGQNPLEPARLSCAVVVGPHTENFGDMYQEMEEIGACLRAAQPEHLAVQIDSLMSDDARRIAMQSLVRQWVSTKSGVTTALLDVLEPIFEAAPV